MNRLRPVRRTVRCLHLGFRTREIASSSKIGDLAEVFPDSRDYLRVGIARGGEIFHSSLPLRGEIAIALQQVKAALLFGQEC
jgi:hypothetical protein